VSWVKFKDVKVKKDYPLESDFKPSIKLPDGSVPRCADCRKGNRCADHQIDLPEICKCPSPQNCTKHLKRNGTPVSRKGGNLIAAHERWQRIRKNK